jgi:HEAT repeat protein
VPQLVKLLGEKEVALREAAAWGLGRLPDRAAAKALVAATGDAKPEVAALACLSLAAQKGEPRASATMLAVARDRSKDDLVRAACALGVGRAGDASAEPQLAAILDAGGGETQRAAARALGWLGARNAERELIHAVFERRDAVREAAAAALCSPRTAPPDPELETLEGKPDAQGYLSRLLATSAARCEKPPAGLAKEAEPAISAALGKHRDIVLRTLVDLDGDGDGLALGPLGAGPTQARGVIAALVPKLSALVAHEDAAVRLHAMRILAKLGNPIVPVIVRAAGDSNLDVARGAADAARFLVAARPEIASQLAAALAARLTSPSWTERTAAARALGADPRLAAAARPALETATHDDVGFVREAAQAALTSSTHPLRSPR